MKNILNKTANGNRLWKRAKRIALIALAVPALNGCFNLDEEPYTFIDPNSFYKDANQMEMAVRSVYEQFGRMINSSYMMAIESATPYGAPTNTKGDMPKTKAWVGVNNPDIGYGPSRWADGFKVVNEANIVLARGEGVNMDETKKKQMFAEVRFLRAYANYILVKLHGPIPIPQGMTTSLSGLEIPRAATVAENYEQIIGDLKFGVETLPSKTQYSADNVWKASKGACQALLGDIYLWRGCMESNTSFFTEAKKYLGDVISSGIYDLQPDFKDLWYWFNTKNKNGIESIFEIQYGVDRNNGITLYFGVVNAQLKELGSLHYLRTGPSISAYLSYGDNDVRKETYLTEFYASNANKVITFVPEDKGVFPGSKGWQSSCPGYLKWYDRTDQAFSNNCSKVNTPMIRFADVLLDYAEVVNHLEGPTADALAKLNKVHTRAGLAAFGTLTKEAFDDAVYQERAWEFVGEGQLYYDGLRTDRLGKLVYQEVRAGNAAKVYQYLPLEFVPQKSFLWKIPTNDMKSNPALEQNPDNVTDSRYPL